MCIITGLVALFSTFAAVGTAIGAGATAAGAVGAVATVVADVAIMGAVAGGVVSTVGAINQAQAAQDQAEYQAEIARQNAAMAAQEAERIELQGNQERKQLLLKAQAARGEARANYAATGVVLGLGTSADMEADIADAYDLDKRNLNYDIANRVWQAKVESVNHSNQAGWYSAQASAYGKQKTNALTSGIIDTTASVIDTGVGLFSLGTSLKGSGIFKDLGSNKAKMVDDPLQTDLANLV